MQGVGGKPLCLPSCRQNCRGTSLFPRKTSFLWNQNPQMGNCWGNCSTRCFDSHEKLSVREQHHQGCSTGEDKLQAKALHCPGRAVSSPTECHPSGSEQSQRGASGRIHWWSQTSWSNLSLGPIHRAQAGPGSAQNYLQYRTQEAGLGLLPQRSGQQGTGLGRSTSTAKLRPGLYREIRRFSVSLINVWKRKALSFCQWECIKKMHFATLEPLLAASEIFVSGWIPKTVKPLVSVKSRGVSTATGSTSTWNMLPIYNFIFSCHILFLWTGWITKRDIKDRRVRCFFICVQNYQKK